MKIKSRLRLNTWFSLGAIGIMMLTLGWSIREVNRTDQNVLLIDEMRKAAYERMYLRDNFLLNSDEAAIIRWKVQSDKLRASLETAVERLKGSEDQALLKKVRTDFESTLSAFLPILETPKRKESDGRAKMFFDETESSLIRQAFLSGYALNTHILGLNESVRRASTAVRNKIALLIFLFVVGIVIVIVFNSIFIGGIVTKRIAALDDGVERIGGGDLDFRIDETGHDELSDLAHASNEMIAKLRESQIYVESIIDTVREPLIALDQDLRVVTVSRAFYDFFKVKPEETVGKLVYELGDKQWDIPKLRELLETILPQKAVFDDYEVEHEFAGIGRRVMLLNARQIQRVFGKERIILLAIEDITERKAVEAGLEKTRNELEAANKELEAFTYSVSHDLRAPLRGVLGFSRILVDEHAAQLSPEVQRYLNLVLSNTLQMGRLVDDLLSFSRFSRQTMATSLVDPAALVRESYVLLTNDQPGRLVRMTIGNLPACRGDRGLLKQVFVNLLSNALKFTRERDPAVIEVSSFRRDGEIVYFVRDNGAGFDMRYVGKLFGVFQRLHAAKAYEGTGVGLAIVQRIIVRHGGRIWAEGEPDKGAVFYFTLGGTVS